MSGHEEDFRELVVGQPGYRDRFDYVSVRAGVLRPRRTEASQADEFEGLSGGFCGANLSAGVSTSEKARHPTDRRAGVLYQRPWRLTYSPLDHVFPGLDPGIATNAGICEDPRGPSPRTTVQPSGPVGGSP
ncbi:MAG: hypothetical protein QOG25_1411 [Acetobacteraceae bacterium]|nr:hypothetical protein [Acetobacteraceae bacterium]